MDKIKDESPDVQKATITFFGENGPIEAEKSENDDDLQTIDWNKHPPMVKIDSRKYLTQQSPPLSERRKMISHGISLAGLVLAIAVIWSLMLIPQLCYFQVGVCQQGSTNGQGNLPGNDSNTTCSGNVYTGICQAHFNSCSSPLVNRNVSSTMESQLSILFSLVERRQTTEPSCYNAIEELKVFLCRYSHQPCDDSLRVLRPTRSQCEFFRDKACLEGWSLLSSLYGELLPDCSSLPDRVPLPNCSVTNTPINISATISAVPTPTSTVSPTPTPSDSSGYYINQCNISYPGSTCQSYLSICPGTDPDIELFDSSTESSIGLASGFLQPGSTCGNGRELVLRFLCQVAFRPCDDDDIIHLPNRTTCEYIRDTLCPTEWLFLQNSPSFAGLLPICSTLPAVSDTPSCINDPPTQPPTTSPTPSISLRCNEEAGFYFYTTTDNTSIYNNTCLATCDKWHIFDSIASVEIRDYSMIASIMIGLISGAGVVFFSILRYKRMFSFPSMFIFYQTITTMVLGITLLIQFSDRFTLSCFPDNLVNSTINDSTPFCKFSGFILLFSLLSLTFWWFAHVASSFWKVMFPFHAKKHENKTMCIHITVVIIGILLSTITPLVCLLTEGYTVHRFPPVLCAPRDDRIVYYGVVLPISILLCIGISFLLIILHVLHQKQGLFKHRKSTSYFLGLSTAEKKLLLLFVYYIIFSIIDITAYTISSSVIDNAAKAIQKEFLCELEPRDLTQECPKDYLAYNFTDGFSVTTYILLALFNCMNLLFAVNLSEIKAKCHRCFKFFSGDFRSRSMTTSAARDNLDTPFSLRKNISYSINNSNKQQANGVSKELNTLDKNDEDPSVTYIKKTTLA